MLLHCYFDDLGVARLAAAASGNCSLKIKVVLGACCLRQFSRLERLIDDFDTEAEALDAVRALTALNGADCTDTLALTRVDSDGRMTTLAMGADLAARAEATRLGRGQLPV